MARTLDYGRLKMACRSEAARFDAVQLEGRERRQFEARSLELTEDANGVTHVRGQLDPVRGGILRTYLDAQVKAAFQARREGPDDDRTATQIRADALVALATHGLDCESPASGVKATIIVRIDRDQLERDVGVATCDAIGTPISLTALRQLAVDATVLPMVMNGKSEVLDQGREQRLFTLAAAHGPRRARRRVRQVPRAHLPLHHPPHPVVVQRRPHRPPQRAAALHAMPHPGSPRQVGHRDRRRQPRVVHHRHANWTPIEHEYSAASQPSPSCEGLEVCAWRRGAPKGRCVAAASWRPRRANSRPSPPRRSSG